LLNGVTNAGGGDRRLSFPRLFKDLAPAAFKIRKLGYGFPKTLELMGWMVGRVRHSAAK
jgi:hypothetical protein